jgi:hypothetical protein
MMNRKLFLFCLSVISSVAMIAQQPDTKLINGCGSGITSQQWEEWMEIQVEKSKQNKSAGKSQIVNHTIPVIVHVIYFNETVPTFPNIDSNQIKSQIAALNADFAGQGLNVNQVPSYFANKVANTGIQFCLAAKDQQDQPLIEKGIHRVGASANSWLSPSTPTLDLQNYFNTVIIPATIWDPTKYLNIWISDRPPSYTVNGWATYPPAPGITGVFGGPVGSISNDGIWIWTKAFGTVGTLQGPFDKGRNLTHEVGHWLGLRHTWGDGNCLSDYANDTPWSKQAHYGCQTSTPPDLCGVSQAPFGEMTMNFMDRSDDACMYMFTPDQAFRMQTVLSQSPLRYLLGTHNKCIAQPLPPTTSSAVAAFVTNTAACLNVPFTPINNSSGYPYPTFVWSASPAGQFFPNSTVANPAITLGNPGTYTITLVATNSLSSSSASMLVTVGSGTCPTVSFCLDSLKMIKSVDTLTSYKAPASSILNCNSGWTGYMAGTNCYKDKEFAQYFPPSSYTSVPQPQVNSVIVLFDSVGTSSPNNAAQVKCKIYGGTVGQGPGSVIDTKSDSIFKITSSTRTLNVSYLGKANYPPKTNTKIIPFKFDFATPVIVNAGSGFFVGIEPPTTSTLDSVNIFHNTKFNSSTDSSAWFLQITNNWRTYKYNRNSKIQLAIIPQITCSPIVGIKEESLMLYSNVNLMPNPNSGMFSVIFTLPKEQKLRMRIYNSIGQTVSDMQMEHVMNNIIDIDLSDEPNGIYFAEVTAGNEKTVKKIVITH